VSEDRGDIRRSTMEETRSRDLEEEASCHGSWFLFWFLLSYAEILGCTNGCCKYWFVVTVWRGASASHTCPFWGYVHMLWALGIILVLAGKVCSNFVSGSNADHYWNSQLEIHFDSHIVVWTVESDSLAWAIEGVTSHHVFCRGWLIRKKNTLYFALQFLLKPVTSGFRNSSRGSFSKRSSQMQKIHSIPRWRVLVGGSS